MNILNISALHKPNHEVYSRSILKKLAGTSAKLPMFSSKIYERLNI